jgi:hypothetical protein
VIASRFVTYLGFAVWVSICAAAPEFIWQGLLSLSGHFSRHNVYAIILIGLILTVFVEPILERAREGRWTTEHRNARSLLLTAPIAFTFGVVAVGLHECMTAYLGSSHGGPDDGVTLGAKLILEWAWIPLAVTLAWFGARLPGRWRWFAGIVAAIWVVGVGFAYAWPWRDIVMSSIPCIAMLPLGQRYVARHWDQDTFRNLAIGLAGLAVAWLLLTLLLQYALTRAGITAYYLYAPGDLGSDFRFYLGWAIGLALAPNPVPVEDHAWARR